MEDEAYPACSRTVLTRDMDQWVRAFSLSNQGTLLLPGPSVVAMAVSVVPLKKCLYIQFYGMMVNLQLCNASKRNVCHM